MASRPPIRIGDAERDHAVDMLREHMAAGRLDPDEFTERMSIALSARIRNDLDGLFVDLPTDPNAVGGMTRWQAPKPPLQQHSFPSRLFYFGLIAIVFGLVMIGGNFISLLSYGFNQADNLFGLIVGGIISTIGGLAVLRSNTRPELPKGRAPRSLPPR